MNPFPDDTIHHVIQIVQILLLSQNDKSSVTPELIMEKINTVLDINPAWSQSVDRQKVLGELIRRFSLWIGKDAILTSNEDHVQWLNASRKREWRYWRRYSNWLDRFLPPSAVESIDRSTDTILGLLEDPLRKGAWNRKGLVVGHVQSGKTGNYAGLICKAADAGYKIIIVLAGLHNNLRAQTQARLDEAFLGYETKLSTDDLRIVGVGEIDSDISIRPNYATNRTENGDFNTKVFKSLGISPEERPWLFVVKKNKTVLDRLHKWIRNHVANTTDQHTGKKIVTHLPLLLVDDEADHASVDTGVLILDSDGKPDLDHEPKAINSLIRKILVSFSRAAYIGYTATPFANIFIHEHGRTNDEGSDLFPASFILNLAAPSNYIGPAMVFGVNEGDDRRDGLPLIRITVDSGSGDDSTGWLPSGHKNYYRPLFKGKNSIPPSLVEAIDAFVLACAARILRNQEKLHSSMLIHVTRFTSVQNTVTEHIKIHLDQMKQRVRRKIDSSEVIERLRYLWLSDFVPTTIQIRRKAPDLVEDDLPDWNDVEQLLPDVLSDIQIMTINGKAKEALEYTKKHVSGMRVIAIGGDKLSRGLTLEGLTTSYFLRASRMYDTLMQMGRWFGYRTGYLDLCRLYTTEELSEWFKHITDASEELRQEFDLMAIIGSTPKDYGLKVQSHPVLMVTSKVKMRTAKKLYLSYSGTIVETVAFYRASAMLRHNLKTTINFVKEMGVPDELNPARTRAGKKDSWRDSYLWNQVPSTIITDFLSEYRTHPAAHKVNSHLICEFIKSMSQEGELTEWTVALMSGGTDKRYKISEKISVVLARRSPNNSSALDRYSIARVLSPRDEAIDLDSRAWAAAFKITSEAWQNDPARLHDPLKPPEIPSGPAIRRVRGLGAEGIRPHPERGLLILYLLDPSAAQIDLPDCPPVAFAISFPSSKSATKVEYLAQTKLWEQEYGLAE